MTDAYPFGHRQSRTVIHCEVSGSIHGVTLG